MPAAMDTRTALLQNLADAGCNSELTEQFMTFLEQGKIKAGMNLLTKHRKHLLDVYHTDQRRIDCLDYLIFQLTKQV